MANHQLEEHHVANEDARMLENAFLEEKNAQNGKTQPHATLSVLLHIWNSYVEHFGKCLFVYLILCVTYESPQSVCPDHGGAIHMGLVLEKFKWKVM